MSHKKPIIDLIMTGGTISSSLDVKTGAVKWLTSPGELFKFYPDIFELADIRIINPFMKASENRDAHTRTHEEIFVNPKTAEIIAHDIITLATSSRQ